MRGRGKGKKKGREEEEDLPEARGSGRKSPTAPSAEVVPTTTPTPTTKPKEMTAPQMAAAKASTLAAVANTPPSGRDRPPSTTPVKERKEKHAPTHESLAQLYPDFTVVKKGNFKDYVNIPSNFMRTPEGVEKDSVLLCKKCPLNKKSGKCWFGTFNPAKLKTHVELHKTKDVADKKEKDVAKNYGLEESSVDSDRADEPESDSKVSFADALVRGMIHAGLSTTQAAKVLAEWGPFLNSKPAEDGGCPPINEVKLKGLVEKYLLAQDADYVSHFAEMEHVGLTFDGGTSKAFGMHLVVTYVFSARKKIALPIVYLTTGRAFDGAQLASTIIGQLREYGICLEKVRVCRY